MSSIAFECGQCGKAFQVSATLAGKTGRCKQCGALMTIPSARPTTAAPAAAPSARTRPVVDPYGLDEDGVGSTPRVTGQRVVIAEDDDAPDEHTPEATESVLSGRVRPTATAAKPQSTSAPKKKKKKAKAAAQSGGGFSIPWREIGGGISTVFVVLLIIFRVARVGRIFIPRGGGNQAVAAATEAPRQPIRDVSQFQDGPISLPRFPDLGPGREVQPGITRHEIVFGPTNPPINTLPGQGGKLWVYLPSGNHAAHSLACVLIGATGGDWSTGVVLGEEDQAMHLPFVRAGFAVVAFETDGSMSDDNEDEAEATTRFRAARAGMTNAHIALEFTLAQLPMVDPAQISIAGYSSAGTLAVLFAEHETRLKAVAAFEPLLDAWPAFDEDQMMALRQIGATDLATRYLPRQHLANLSCPLFLFHSRNNVVIPASQAVDFTKQAQSVGKTVTLDLSDQPFGVQTTLQQGIPLAIAWLKENHPR